MPSNTPLTAVVKGCRQEFQFHKRFDARFWEKVDKTDGCWNWIAARGSVREKTPGYGHFGYLGKTHLAHRLSWKIHFGEIPAGIFVLHKCDNPGCVRPDHLFLGTHADNMADAKTKGRMIKPKMIGPVCPKHRYVPLVHWKHPLNDVSVCGFKSPIKSITSDTPDGVTCGRCLMSINRKGKPFFLIPA